MISSRPTRVHTATLRSAALHAGQRILLTGTVYTARDAAHKRVAELLDAGRDPPFPLRDAVLYYTGPTPAPPGRPIGSAGPTTSARMDPYTPRLYGLGLCAAIGKGPRSETVRRSIAAHRGLYLCAVGGAGALLAGCVTACEEVAFPELGCESVKRLEILDLPLVVAIDAAGDTIFSPE
jgi:fumarate hydratase subunit beta